ncbi:MAG: MFS transporter, partial [Myxococcaceae bacterium]|nr:MFS transporter [Myxococcaceae bacterium]
APVTTDAATAPDKQQQRARLVPLAVLQVSSGMPYGFLITGAFAVFLRGADVSLTAIGLLSLVSLPWNLKFLWAPIVDRYALTWPDRRRSWLLISQVACSIGFIAIAALVFFAQRGGGAFDGTLLLVLAGIALFIAFAGATQDIAVDAFAVEYLRPNEQGPASGLRTMFWRIGFLLTAGAAVFLADPIVWEKLGITVGKNEIWPWVFAAIALLFLPLLWLTVRCPPAERPADPPRSLGKAVVEPLANFFGRPGALWLAAFLFFYKFGDNLSSSMWIPFLVDKGITRAEIGILSKTLGSAAVVIGATAGGALIPRLGLGRSLWIFGVVQGLSSGFYALASYAGGARWSVYLAIVGENVAIGLGTPALLTVCLRACEKRLGATQYALLSSIFALGRWATGPPAGMIAEGSGYTALFLCGIAAALPGLLILQVIAPIHQRDVISPAIPKEA